MISTPNKYDELYLYKTPLILGVQPMVIACDEMPNEVVITHKALHYTILILIHVKLCEPQPSHNRATTSNGQKNSIISLISDQKLLILVILVTSVIWSANKKDKCYTMLRQMVYKWLTVQLCFVVVWTEVTTFGFLYRSHECACNKNSWLVAHLKLHNYHNKIKSYTLFSIRR